MGRLHTQDIGSEALPLVMGGQSRAYHSFMTALCYTAIYVDDLPGDAISVVITINLCAQYLFVVIYFMKVLTLLVQNTVPHEWLHASRAYC